MNIFLVNQDHPSAHGLIEKLTSSNKNGGIVPLTSEEMDLYRSTDFEWIFTSETKESIDVLRVDPEEKYIFVVDKTVCFDDIVNAAQSLYLNYGIIRHD